MGLLQQAARTYDVMQARAGEYHDGESEPLAPVGHIIAKAQIEITLDREGNVLQAISRGKDSDQKIIIPATENSAGRSGTTVAPHPLCDQLGYITEQNSEKHDAYAKQLQQWLESPYSHPMLSPIYTFVTSGAVLETLEKFQLMKRDDKGAWKNEKDVLCFRVVGIGEESGACWESVSLMRQFTAYNLSCLEATREKELCLISGKEESVAYQHLKGVVALNGNAKIISANDHQNFTYRGRFTEDRQAVTVGYLASQKAHNALKWLIANQGTIQGGRTFLCWSPNGVWDQDPFKSFFETDKETAKTPTEYREKLQKYIESYRVKLPNQNDVVIASFDAATTGRLSVTYYREMQGSDLLERMKVWDETCCWINRFGVSSPSLYQIASCAFGVQRGDGDGARMEVDDRVLRQIMQRLLLCRIEMAPFPHDIVQSLINKASNLQTYSKNNREKILFATCASIRKYYLDHQKEEYIMSLEPEKKDRSYQYGRLLAIMEKAERDTYASGETREPNAIRMQSVFSKRPLYASRVVLEQLEKAFFPRLAMSSRVYYKRLIGEVMEQISLYGEDQDATLADTYLLGYYLQRNAFYTKKENNNTEEEENV